MFIFYYLLIGVLLMFLLDIHLYTYKDKIEMTLQEEINYDNFTRLFIIIVWPAAVIIIIKNLPW